MKRYTSRALAALVMFVASSQVATAQHKDAVSQSEKAAKVFREIMGAPDKSIPKDILQKAECVAVFPQVIKAGFIVGGRGGRGLASCRTPKGWSGPSYLDMGGGSFGLQIGAQAVDFILLFMNKDGMNKLLGDKFEIGGDATAAAGPVGRQAGASTNIRLDAQILSYSRSKGLFAGLELKGVIIGNDSSNNEKVYGKGVKPTEILQGTKTPPADVAPFAETLTRYSPRKAK